MGGLQHQEATRLRAGRPGQSGHRGRRVHNRQRGWRPEPTGTGLSAGAEIDDVHVDIKIEIYHDVAVPFMGTSAGCRDRQHDEWVRVGAGRVADCYAPTIITVVIADADTNFGVVRPTATVVIPSSSTAIVTIIIVSDANADLGLIRPAPLIAVAVAIPLHSTAPGMVVVPAPVVLSAATVASIATVVRERARRHCDQQGKRGENQGSEPRRANPHAVLLLHRARYIPARPERHIAHKS